jgi:uncharacterized coiled-coil DUF342 family protein
MNRLDKVEKDVEKITDEIVALQNSSSRSDEQIKMVFKILNEIKDSINGISKELKDLSLKPAKKWDDLIGTLLATGLGAIIGVAISKIFI